MKKKYLSTAKYSWLRIKIYKIKTISSLGDDMALQTYESKKDTIEFSLENMLRMLSDDTRERIKSLIKKYGIHYDSSNNTIYIERRKLLGLLKEREITVIKKLPGGKNDGYTLMISKYYDTWKNRLNPKIYQEKDKCILIDYIPGKTDKNAVEVLLLSFI